MKKIAKKIFIFLILISASFYFSGASSFGLNFETEKAEMTNFLDVTKNRTAGSADEKKSADYLSSQLAEMGLAPLWEDYQKSFNFSDATSQNVAGVKDNGSDKYVVIGSHYDGIFKLSESYGVNDNASGVVCNLQLARELAARSLPFNLIFAFFGAEEAGLCGSEAFLSSLDAALQENILLYINLDSIGAGDELYYFHSDFKTAYGDFIDQSFANLEINKLQQQEAFFSARPAFGLNFSHLGYLSDNASFLKKGINSLNFFAGKLSGLNFGFHETDSGKQMHKTDSVEKIEETFGDKFYENIVGVKSAVLTLLENENFMSGTEKRELSPAYYSSFLLKGIGIGVIALLAAGTVIFFKVKEKKKAK